MICSAKLLRGSCLRIYKELGKMRHFKCCSLGGDPGVGLAAESPLGERYAVRSESHRTVISARCFRQSRGNGQGQGCLYGKAISKIGPAARILQGSEWSNGLRVDPRGATRGR